MQRWFSLVLVVIISSSWPAAAGTLERVRDAGEFKIGHREDAAPFSYKNALGDVAGYSVDLCRLVAVQLKKQLALDDMKVTYVPVTAENRFDAVQEGRIDILSMTDLELAGGGKDPDFWRAFEGDEDR